MRSISYLCGSSCRKEFEIGENSDEEIDNYTVCDQVAHNLLLSLSCARLKLSRLFNHPVQGNEDNLTLDSTILLMSDSNLVRISIVDFDFLNLDKTHPILTDC